MNVLWQLSRRVWLRAESVHSFHDANGRENFLLVYSSAIGGEVDSGAAATSAVCISSIDDSLGASLALDSLCTNCLVEACECPNEGIHMFEVGDSCRGIRCCSPIDSNAFPRANRAKCATYSRKRDSCRFRWSGFPRRNSGKFTASFLAGSTASSAERKRLFGFPLILGGNGNLDPC